MRRRALLGSRLCQSEGATRDLLKRARQAEGVEQCVLNQIVDRGTPEKTDLRLCRMNVHIDLLRGDLDEEVDHGVSSPGQKRRVGLLDRMKQAPASNRPGVDEENLLSRSRTMQGGPGCEALNPCSGLLMIDRYQLLGNIPPHDLRDSFSVSSDGGPGRVLPAAEEKVERDAGMSRRNAGDNIRDVCAFGRLRAQKLAPRRCVVKQALYENRRASRVRRRLDRNPLADIHPDPGPLR